MSQFPIKKAWKLLSGATGRNLYRSENPLVYLTTELPQRAYLRAWERARTRRTGLAYGWTEKLSLYTLGYAASMLKPGRDLA